MNLVCDALRQRADSGILNVSAGRQENNENKSHTFMFNLADRKLSLILYTKNKKNILKSF